ncbi:MAG: hypothetical protein JKY54_15600 [Flavobacteriales bacterium]|nr:hypothetical protein [Flavobacteriales bacterium]
MIRFTGLILMLFAVCSYEAKDLHVPANYSTIQKAINAANDGDKILIASGNYEEYLIINKSISLIGTQPCSIYASTSPIKTARNKKALINIADNEVFIQNIDLIGIWTNNGKSSTASPKSQYCQVAIDVKDGMLDLKSVNMRGFTSSYIKMDGGSLDITTSVLSPPTSIHPAPKVAFVLDDVGAVTMKGITSINGSIAYFFAINETYPGSRESLMILKESNIRNTKLDKGRKGSYTLYGKLSSGSPIASGNVKIPDVNFKAFLIGRKEINTNGDAEISYAEAAAYNISINCTDKGITDLTGIESFTSIEGLYCTNNSIEKLDLTKNVKLMFLDCYNNKLTTLDLSKNPMLKELGCSGNQLERLELSKNEALTVLNCGFELMKSLDVSKNLQLKELYCSNSALTSLDVSKNIALEKLYCGENPLQTLDVSKNVALKVLSCPRIQLTSLNLVSNIHLQKLTCTQNSLAELNVRKNPALKWLACQKNKMTNLDVSDNLKLTYLNCDKNQLNGLNMSTPSLKEVHCGENQITSLDLTKSNMLKVLECDGNKIKTLDLSHTLQLKRLNCIDNKLTVIDVSHLVNLKELKCSKNRLKSLNVKNGNNKSLSRFLAGKNPELRCVQVDDVEHAQKKWKYAIDKEAKYSDDCGYVSSYSANLNTNELVADLAPLPVQDEADNVGELAPIPVQDETDNVGELAPIPMADEAELPVEKNSIKFNADKVIFNTKVDGKDYDFALPGRLQYQSHKSTKDNLVIAYQWTSKRDNYVGIWNEKLEYRAEYKFGKIKVLDYLIEETASKKDGLVFIYYHDVANKTKFAGIFDTKMKYLGQFELTKTSDVKMQFEQGDPMIYYTYRGKAWRVKLDRKGREVKRVKI